MVFHFTLAFDYLLSADNFGGSYPKWDKATGYSRIVLNSMRFIADLEIHSRFARAVSQAMNLPNLALWAAKKGIKVIGTGDFTHPEWFKEILEFLEEAEPGLFKLKDKYKPQEPTHDPGQMRFLLSGEVSLIYNKGGRVRRVHHLIFSPSREVAGHFNQALSRVGNIHSDGRPILGLDSKLFLKMLLDASPECVLIPAHIWTPHFGIFGSASGYDSLEECFDELAAEVFAVETGLSSNPPMNWRIPFLDDRTIMSSSDAHSLRKIGREATIFDTSFSYRHIMEALRRRNESLVGTIEFYPEEGKYHYDGHRSCNVSWSPEETRAHRGSCSVCGRPVTVGVVARVEALAAKDRPSGFKPPVAKPYYSLIPLEELIAEALDVGVGSRMVEKLYEEALRKLGSELTILLETPSTELGAALPPLVAEAIRRVRDGEVEVTPGYDGEYGKISIFTDAQRRGFARAPQQSLF